MFTVSLVDILGMAWFHVYWGILKETKAKFIRNTVASIVAVSCHEDVYGQENVVMPIFHIIISVLNRK